MKPDADNQGSKKIFAFVHIEKAAGTTLIHILRKNFLFRYCDVRPFNKASNRVFTARDLKRTLCLNPHLKCIGGHSISPSADIDPMVPPMLYFTILRDPVRRYISQYRYWVEKLKRDLSFEAFLEIRSEFNLQTKKLSGTTGTRQWAEVIRERIFHIGIVEKFDDYLIVFKKKLSPYPFNPCYKIINSSKDRKPQATRTESLAEKYRDQIVSRNAEDLELYSYVKDVVCPQDIKTYGETFQEDLRQFRETNANLKESCLPYADYLFRKGYYEPIIGLIRKQNGLSYKGSY